MQARCTATITYLGTPRRARVLAAKLAASFSCGLLFGAAGAATATAVGFVFTLGKGQTIAVGAATMTRYGLGALLGAGLLAAVGAGIGSLALATARRDRRPSGLWQRRYRHRLTL